MAKAKRRVRRAPRKAGVTRKRRPSAKSVESPSPESSRTASVASHGSTKTSDQQSVSTPVTKISLEESRSYRHIKKGLQRSVPAAIVMWAFHKLPSQSGLTSRRIIQFLKTHYKVNQDPRKTGKSIGALLRCAVEFGLISKRGNRYYLKKKFDYDYD